MLTFSEKLYIRLNYSAEDKALVDLTPSSSELITAAGLLVNLMLDNRVRLDGPNLTIVDARPTDDPLLDGALARLAAVGTVDREDPEWFRKIVNTLPLGAEMFGSIMAKNVLTRQEKKGMFGLSKKVLYPFQNQAVREMVFGPERAVMLQGQSPDKETAALIFMAYSWGAPLPWRLSRSENKAYEKRLESLYGDYWGWYDKSQPVEPVPGITAEQRYNIADLSISWATVHMSYVMEEVNAYRWQTFDL